MTTTTATTIPLPNDLHAQAQALATTLGRTLEEVLTEAVAQGLAYDHWIRAEAEKGRRSAEHGPLIPAEQVWSDLLQRGMLTPEAIAQADAEAEHDFAKEPA